MQAHIVERGCGELGCDHGRLTPSPQRPPPTAADDPMCLPTAPQHPRLWVRSRGAALAPSRRRAGRSQCCGPGSVPSLCAPWREAPGVKSESGRVGGGAVISGWMHPVFAVRKAWLGVGGNGRGVRWVAQRSPSHGRLSEEKRARKDRFSPAEHSLISRQARQVAPWQIHARRIERGRGPWIPPAHASLASSNAGYRGVSVALGLLQAEIRLPAVGLNARLSPRPVVTQDEHVHLVSFARMAARRAARPADRISGLRPPHSQRLWAGMAWMGRKRGRIQSLGLVACVSWVLLGMFT